MSAAAHVEVFTDGACKGNPGPGGWGAILRAKGQERELRGAEALTTNNRMELTAAIEAPVKPVVCRAKSLKGAVVFTPVTALENVRVNLTLLAFVGFSSARSIDETMG